MPASDPQILSSLVKRMKAGQEDPLRPLVDRYYLYRGRSTSRLSEVTLPVVERLRPGGRLSPSTIGGCQRQAVFKFLGVRGRRRIDPDTELIFERGNWIHHQWQTTFLDMERVLGAKCIKVLSIEGSMKIRELFVAGNSDVLLIIKVSGVRRRVVVDVKSINNAGFQRVIMDDAPLPSHVTQLVTYMKAEGVRLGILWYDNKDNSQTHGFLIKFSEGNWEEVEQWCREVIRYLERKRLPQKHVECQSGTFMYERCPYAGLCFGRKDSEEVRSIAYRGFKGVKAAWRAGMKAIEGQK